MQRHSGFMHVTITTILNRFEAKTETPTTGVRHRLWLGIALCVLVPALSVVVPANAHLLLQTGAFVEIKPHNARRPLRAAAIIVPDPAESELRDTDEIVLRAPIEQVDRGAAV
ncbi:MAG TPA: hypothetical protein VLB27_04555, partial [candidate division Zixibacteria bacterium]|nr:hypothetical protein [candidate division Zixibacteria bacterium]